MRTVDENDKNGFGRHVKVKQVTGERRYREEEEEEEE